MTDPESAAFRAEAHALAAALAGLSPDDWDQPTRCEPWTVRDVVGHLVTALGRLPHMLTQDEPDHPDTDATGYYRPDARFSLDANTDRIHTAQTEGSEDDLVAAFTAAAYAVDDAYRAVTPARRVRTRHGDAMLLSAFLTTRTVEVAVHGLDITDALAQPPCLTPAGAAHLPQALLGPEWHRLGWDPVTLLRKVSGRTQVFPEEADRMAQLGAGRLAFG